MKKNLVLIIGILFVSLAACNSKTENNSEMSEKSKTETKSEMSDNSNPLLSKSPLPYQAPDFTKIKDSDFEPAFEAGIKEQLEEIDKIANNTEEPTFENTLAALEKSGQTLSRVNMVFEMLSGAYTNDILQQQLQEKIAPKLAALHDAIFLNDTLFERIKAVSEKKDQLGLDAESTRLLEYYSEMFIKAGAGLPSEDKTKLKKLNEEAASLEARFTNQLLEGTKDGALVVDDPSELKGLSDAEINALAQHADAAGQAGRYLISLQNTTQQPLLQTLENRDTREKLFDASWNRTEKGDDNDTRGTIKRIAEIRIEKAHLLGFDDYAAWNLQDQMAKTPEAVQQFLDQLVAPSVANAKKRSGRYPGTYRPAERWIRSRTLGLEFLCRAGQKSPLRPGRRAGEALFRIVQCTGKRCFLYRYKTLRNYL